MNAMMWNDQTPIFRQLKEKVVELIMDGEVSEGEAVPSVRQVAADYQINPLTVSKAYQELVDDQILEKKRGLGMFVTQGAKDKLFEDEKKQFLEVEWPKIMIRIQRLGLSVQELTKQAVAADGENS
ncbi:GntR family transcriptional regulator [Aliikangiella coralliicola]|uniref:GntR family transcriptional regulator n=1 Tax=Aliikangiella coralliicola TaxID=2592383 RepID=A0A545UDE9_9GAMM|nr:GntR family transcriptional regulator [Aliikangiella coralliicola]TQV87479.1 GntR family transcriptional regulator [Aliikangiella coralliicola]